MTGFYIDFIGEWFDRFGERFHVVIFDQLRSDPRSSVSRVLEWLDLDSQPARTFTLDVQNPTVEPRSMALQRMGMRVNRALGGRLSRASPIGRLVKGTYRSLNERREGVVMQPETRERVNVIYEDANNRLGDYLRARGFSDLPGWMGS